MSATDVPWTDLRSGASGGGVYSRFLMANGRHITLQLIADKDDEAAPHEAVAHAARVAACLNACVGLTTEHLQALGVGGLTGNVDAGAAPRPTRPG